MLRALKIGHIYGVDVNVHPTFTLVLAWAIWQWGISPARGFVPFMLGIVLVVLVFGSVLLHELGHCVMARQFGTRVLDATLWPFGGVARIEQLPAQPRSEFLIALAGPATNLAIVVALLPPLLLIGVLAGWGELFSTRDPLVEMTLATLLSYLALTNLFLMIFNLIPAFPLDGGRMFRSMMIGISGRDVATRIAVAIGIVFAILFVVVGAWRLNPVLVLLGLFVIFAAQAEARAERVLSGMQRLTVGQYALWDMGGVDPGEPLTFALRGGPRDMAVTRDGLVVGMLWRDQLLAGLAQGMSSRTVGEIMDTDVWTADAGDSIFDVQRLMSQTSRWAVPVTEDGRYRGIFTADRFVSLYHQISPGMMRSVAIPAEWRDAVSETVTSWAQRLRR